MTWYITVDMVYGAILRYYRKQAKLTQRSVCCTYGVTNTVYSRYERGELPVPATFIFMLVKRFDKSYAEVARHVVELERSLSQHEIHLLIAPPVDETFIVVRQSVIDSLIKYARSILTIKLKSERCKNAK